MEGWQQGDIFLTETCSDLRTLGEKIGSPITEASGLLSKVCLGAKQSAGAAAAAVIVVGGDQVLLYNPGWLQTCGDPPASGSFVTMFGSVEVTCKLPG